MRPRAFIAFCGALAATLVVCTAASAETPPRVPALAPAPADGLSRALARGEISEAEYSLERARSLFARPAVAARYGPVARPDPRAATLVLRDLAVRLQSLSPRGRAQAERLLARPDDGIVFGPGPGFSVESRFDCTAHACFHWVDATDDAPPPGDSDGDTIPDQVDRTAAIVETVWATEIDAYGYRPPKPDLTSPNHGPDEKIDIYLADLGADGLYGYCATDDPNISTGYRYANLSAYCVLDDDFSPEQFPGDTTSEEALEVTVAHEFFHAIQFGYDIYEDGWLMEGTAVWMEDEVFDDVNDNYQYLDSSALLRPGVPLDLAVPDFSSPLAGFQYGAFLFWRYLSEDLGTPDVIRQVWELAQDVPDAADQYSLQAVSSMLGERGTSLSREFARFAAANAYPASFYEEGIGYPRPPLARRVLNGVDGSVVKGEKRLDHLTSWYVAFRPGTQGPASARLEVEVDLPPLEQGSAARLLVVRRSGTVRRVPIALDAAGDGARTVSFARSQVATVVLVLSNASERFNCWRFTMLSCHGTPLDDAALYRYGLRVVGGRRVG